MSNSIEQKLQELSIELPVVSAPVAKYLPYVISGNQVIVSGQISRTETGAILTGKCGVDLTAEQGQVAARNCALQIISIVKQACEGDLSRVKKCVKLAGFISSSPDFYDHPVVMNGASNLMVDVFGEDIGMHARAAVGMSALPLNAAVEVEAIFEIA